jgi:hypothetical protein
MEESLEEVSIALVVIVTIVAGIEVVRKNHTGLGKSRFRILLAIS